MVPACLLPPYAQGTEGGQAGKAYSFYSSSTAQVSRSEVTLFLGRRLEVSARHGQKHQQGLSRYAPGSSLSAQPEGDRPGSCDRWFSGKDKESELPHQAGTSFFSSLTPYSFLLIISFCLSLDGNTPDMQDTGLN